MSRLKREELRSGMGLGRSFNLKQIYPCKRATSYRKTSWKVRSVRYFKDRIENFDDYYPSTKKHQDCDLSHVYSRVAVFVSRPA